MLKTLMDVEITVMYIVQKKKRDRATPALILHNYCFLLPSTNIQFVRSLLPTSVCSHVMDVTVYIFLAQQHACMSG
jgi:hypothetical protein